MYCASQELDTIKTLVLTVFFMIGTRVRTVQLGLIGGREKGSHSKISTWYDSSDCAIVKTSISGWSRKSDLAFGRDALYGMGSSTD